MLHVFFTLIADTTFCTGCGRQGGLKMACTRLSPASDYKTAGILLGCFFGLDNNQYWKKKIASMSHSVSDYCPATVRSAAAKY